MKVQLSLLIDATAIKMQWRRAVLGRCRSRQGDTGNGKREDMQLISRVRSILGVVGREITRYALWNWVRALVQ